MFRKDAPHVETTPMGTPRLETIIGDGTVVTGEIKVDGDLRVEGEVDGSISVSNRVVVGKTGVVKADVDAGSAEIAGRVVGRVNAKERVVLAGGSRLEGDVQAHSFKIDDGAFFQGNCVMGDPSAMKKVDEPPRIRLADGNEG